jgi:Mn2+/Fe2+ NRAMP family transporter
MKPMRWSEIGLLVAGVLIGFAFGISACVFFFLPLNAQHSGWAKFIATGCGFVGLLLLILIRVETSRKEDINEKPDA